MARKKKPTPAAETPTRADGWSNLLTGLGTSRDKRMAARVQRGSLGPGQARDIYAGDGMAARIVDLPVDELTRKWVDVKVADDGDAAERADQALTDLHAAARFKEALRHQRVLGGGAILLGVVDGAASLEEPLDLKRVRSVRALTVLERTELTAAEYFGDPTDRDFGEPRLFTLSPRTAVAPGLASYQRVHASRLLLFPGRRLSRLDIASHSGWGESELLRVVEALVDFAAGYGGAGALVQDFAQGVLKLKGVADMLSSTGPEGPAMLKVRLEAMDLSRSTLRSVILDADAGESFERTQTPTAGLPELLDRFAQRLAAVSRIPVTLLMGESPAGLSATGDSDVRAFYDRIAAEQGDFLVPNLTRLCEVLFAAREGPTRGSVPETWSVVPRPLWQLSETEQADVRLKTAQADQIYIQAQVLTPEEVAESRFGGDAYSTETQLDRELRDALGAAKEEEPTLVDGEQPVPVDPKAPAAGAAAGAAPAAADPTKPAIPEGVATGEVASPDTALSGVQSAAMLDIIRDVIAGQIPMGSAIAMMKVTFALSDEAAHAILDPTVGFEPAAPEPDPAQPAPVAPEDPKPPAAPEPKA